MEIRGKTTFFIFITTFVLQSIFHRFFPFLLGLDLYTIFVYFVSRRYNLKNSMIIGSAAGIFEDITMAHTIPIGVNGISKLFVSIFGYFLSRFFNFENVFVGTLIIYVLTIVDKLMVILIFSIFGIPFNFNEILVFIISPITNSAFYLIFFLLANFKKWKR